MGTEDKLRAYLKRATVELAQTRRRLAEVEERHDEPIAVIGMACRYPGGAGTVDGYWDLLRDGRHAVREVPSARWDIDDYYDPDPRAPGGIYTRYGTFLDDVAGWDAEFFGLSPREALRMDPQQRILLELAWEGLESAGLSPTRMRGSRTGVMVGFMDTLQYGRLQMERQGRDALSDPYLGQGAIPSVAAGRIAYQLDLIGPTLTVDTACSSSLIAVHLAAQALRRGECDLALAAGASLSLHPTLYIQACAGLMMCADGRCKTFDESADGYVMGEGGGLVVLEPLSKALANGRRIRAVLRGSAVNQDGRSNGLTAPSRKAQADVITRALAAARVTPGEIDYVEAHGSGTHLGDAIELSALHDVFGGRSADRPLRVGAVKTNIGHTQAAAGVAGLIKTVLILENELIPPSLNLTTPAAAIPADGTVQPVTAPVPLPRRDDAPRLAGVSSFGLSGTNAHLILQAAPPHPSLQPEATTLAHAGAAAPTAGPTHPATPAPTGASTRSGEGAASAGGPVPAAGGGAASLVGATPLGRAAPLGGATHLEGGHLGEGEAAVGGRGGAPYVLPLSAASGPALREQAERLATWLEARPGTGLADVAHTLQTGRAELDHRRALVCDDAADAVARLRAPGDGHRVKRRPRLAFLLPGVGDQYAGLGRDLYAAEPVYAEAVDQCVDLVRRRSGVDLRPQFFPEGATTASANGDLAALLGRSGETRGAHDPLDQAAIAHPFLFTVEYALARLLRHWGVTPDLLVGYSLGEYVAACLAGVFTLEDALHVVVERAHLISAVPAGRMVAVAAPQDRVLEVLAGTGAEVDVAARNGPAMTVLSGLPAEIEAATAALAATGLACRPLRSAHAFHSTLLQPAREKLAAVLDTVTRRPPDITIVSNLTGRPLTAEEATSTSYWADQLVSTVRFADGVRHCLEEDVSAFVELGAGQTLGGLVRQNLTGGRTAVLGTLAPHWNASPEPHGDLITTCATLWELGAPVNWDAARPGGGHVADLPTYPFQRTRFWPETTAQPVAAEPAPAAGPADHLFAPLWRRDPAAAAPPAGLALPGPLVVFADPGGVGGALADLAAASGVRVVEVVPGTGPHRDGRRLTIDPSDPAQYAEVFAGHGDGPVHVAHLWSLATPAATGDDDLRAAVGHGFDSLMLAVQALGERPARLLTVTRGAADILGGDATAPHQALAHGLGRAVRHEYPNLTWSGVDLDPGEPQPPAGTARQLAAELLTEPGAGDTPESADPLTGWRRGRRWTRGWAPIPDRPGAEGTPVWRADGAYLITGGTRGLGLALARHLVRAGVRRLALLARTPLPDGDADVAALTAAGAEVLLLTADAGVPDELRAALRRARERFGRLHGVIHAAGLPAGGLLQRRTTAEAARVLAPKVYAMGPLAELTGPGTPEEERPELLVLYSSAVTAFGGIGEGDYCAANTVLDAYGQALDAAAPATRVVSVAWGPWQHDVWQSENLKGSGGLAERVADYRARYGFADDAGCALLDRIVAGGHGSVMAVRQPLRDVLASWTSMLDLDGLLATAAPQGERFPRPRLRTDYAPPRTEAEARMADLWGAYLGIDGVGVHDPFFDLGGNSLTGMAMVLAIEKDLGRPIAPAVLFEHPTVAAFTAALDGGGDQGAQEALSTSSARGQRRRRARSSNRK
ncbi:SDR family NAD(P)-dependent oxidoreductase [Nonomuraea sp. NPDC049725]|uniref:type I polyketide synthase n=1 Tax=Nonomuraea sp. NPDC049725 TaxID=3154508 RepID=UPI0034480C09